MRSEEKWLATATGPANRRAVLFTLYSLLLTWPGLATLLSDSAYAQGPELQPVPHPDLAQFEQGVQQAIADNIAVFEEQAITAEGEDLGLAYARLGMVYHAHHLQYVAEICYINAIALSPDDFRWTHLLAFLYQDTGRFEMAAQYYERVIELRPDYLPARLRLALTLLADGRMEDAKRRFNEVLTGYPDDVTALAGLGQIAIEQGQYETAITNLERALELDPEADRLNYPLALALRATGETDKAKAALEKRGRGQIIFSDPILAAMSAFSQSAQMFMERGLAALMTENYDAAATQFEKAIESNPEDPVALATLGRVREFQHREREAMALYDQALTVAPQHVHANYFKGSLLERQGDIQGAVRFYNAAIQSDPGYVEPRFLLANALMRAQRFEAAAGHYDYIRGKNVDRVDARYWAGLAWLAAGQCHRAVDPLEEAVELLPSRGELILTLTRAYATCPGISDERREQSLAFAEELYQIQPDRHTATTYAMAYAANGQFQDAMDLQAQAIFEVIRDGQEPTEFQRETMDRFRNGMMAERAWSGDDEIFVPPRLELELETPAALVPQERQ